MDNENITDISSVAEEDVANMLPVVGLGDNSVVKKELTSTDDEIDQNEKITFSESVIEYMTNPEYSYNDEIEESVKDIANKIKEREVVSAKIAKLVVDIYILKKRIKIVEKGENQKKLIDMKRELVRKQMEMNEIKKTASPELKKEISKIEKNLEKNTPKVDTNDVIDDKGSTTEEHEDDKDKTVNESVITEKEEEKNTLPPELKRLDEIRGRIENLSDDLEVAKKKLKETGEKLYENKIKGLTSKIDKLKKELTEKEKKAKKIQDDNKDKEVEESTEGIITEAADMEDEIKPIVDTFNSKGYKVKYSSPGHKNLRKKEDKEPDGVYYGKLYSDARVMFDDKYDFPNDAPKYWHWREVDGCSYLDITPIAYDEKDGTPDEAFSKWKTNYMNSLKEFADSLKGKTNKEVKESVNEFADSFISEMFSSMGFDELGLTALTETANFGEESSETLINELENLLS